MASFKEYNNTTFYIGPEGTAANDGTHTFFLLSDKYSKYPVITPNLGTIWFGLKQDDTFNKILSQNIDTYNGGNGVYFTSSASDCWAKIGPTNETYSPDSDTGMTIKFGITHTQKFREITFKWKDFVVFKFIQYGQPNKLLICKPTWDIDPYTITSYAIIGFSTSATSIRSMAFDAGQGGTYLKKSLCAIEQLNNPNTIQWKQETIQYLDTLKYIKGINYKTNGMSDYTLIKVIVDTGEEIIEDDFDRIKELGIIYIYVRKNINGDYVRVGRITMAEQGEYMLGEIA